MKIEQLHEQFILRDGEKQIGELTYVLVQEHMRIDYVGVDPQYRGQGLAQQLVEAAALWAQEQGVKIVPVCPYARAVLRRDKRLAELCSFS